MTILERVRTVLSKELGLKLDQVDAADRLKEDLGADSLDQIEIEMAIEEEFGIDLDDKRMGLAQTVSDIVGVVAWKLGEGPVPSFFAEDPEVGNSQETQDKPNLEVVDGEGGRR